MALPETFEQPSELIDMQANLAAILAEQPSVERAQALEAGTTEVLDRIGIDALVAGADYTPSVDQGTFDYRAKLAIGMAGEAAVLGVDATTPTDVLGEAVAALKSSLFTLEHPAEDAEPADPMQIAAKRALLSSLGRRLTDERAAGPDITQLQAI